MLKIKSSKKWNSHGDGKTGQFGKLGHGVVLEDGVRAFFRENIYIEDNVYIGHDSIIKGYFDKTLKIDSGTWIGPQCFIYASGGIEIGKSVGIGPGVKIFSSSHEIDDTDIPILHAPLTHKPIIIKDGADIGAGSIILGGVTIGEGAQIGAGAVVTKSIEDYGIAAGVPARLLRIREKNGKKEFHPAH